jgi:YVTN family beta-propeller protein
MLFLLAFLLAAAPLPVKLVPLHAIHVGSGDLKSVRLSPDGRLAYVENLEGMRTLVYDTGTYRLIRAIPHVGKPVETAFTDGGRHVWISYLRLLVPGYPVSAPDETRYRYRSQVAVWDARDEKIVARIKVGIMPKFMAVSPDGAIVAVSNWISDNVMLMDASTFKVVATIPVGHVPRGLCFTPDGRWLYVANFRAESMSRVDMRTRKVVKTLHHVGDQPRHIVITPDGRTLYLSTNRDGWLHKYALAPTADGGMEEKLERSVFVGKEARTIELTPDGRYLFAACFTPGIVAAVDTRTMRVVARADVGVGAVGLDLSADGRTLWVVSQPTRTIHVFRVVESPVEGSSLPGCGARDSGSGCAMRMRFMGVTAAGMAVQRTA